jgi:hypothetical protein
MVHQQSSASQLAARSARGAWTSVQRAPFAEPEHDTAVSAAARQLPRPVGMPVLPGADVRVLAGGLRLDEQARLSSSGEPFDRKHEVGARFVVF